MIDRDGNFADFIPSDGNISDVYGNYITLRQNYHDGYYCIDYANKKIIAIQNYNQSIFSNMKIKLKNPDAHGNEIYAVMESSGMALPNVDANSVLCNMMFLVSKNEIIINLQDIFPEASYFKAIECGVYNNKTYYTIYYEKSKRSCFLFGN